VFGLGDGSGSGEWENFDQSSWMLAEERTKSEVSQLWIVAWPVIGGRARMAGRLHKVAGGEKILSDEEHPRPPDDDDARIDEGPMQTS
jgi:hypothetical protein